MGEATVTSGNKEGSKPLIMLDAGERPASPSNYEELARIKIVETHLFNLKRLAEIVVSYDWSDNDDDAAMCVDDLRRYIRKNFTKSIEPENQTRESVGEK